MNRRDAERSENKIKTESNRQARQENQEQTA